MPTPFSADYVVDRRLLERKLSFWRVSAVVLLVAAIAAGGWRLYGGMGPQGLSPHIARLAIEGVITGDKETLKLIDDIGKSHAAGVVVTIDSPGGTTTGAEQLYDALRKLAQKKPTAAVVGTMAASGGYIAALGTDLIVARGNSLVGSIGVLFEFPNFANLLDKIGVQVETVKSAPLKAAPNGFEPTTPQVRAALAALVSDSFDWFKGLVKTRRKMTDENLGVVSDGRVFTGRQGMGLHLVDRLGGEQEAIQWMEQERGVAKDLPVRDWTKPQSLGRLGLLGFSARFADQLGWTDLGALLDRGNSFAQARLLDGLVSIWQADANQ